ncbi:NAD(P)-binding protein [Dentipellis sp. KUC8613]|nr:NAD(P)-binding protein [Dentipellis sp. KUC8613]
MAASTNKLQIFMTGVTGYIGGTVLQLLLEHPKRDTFEITAYVRNAEKAKKLEAFGVRTVLGDLDDVDKLEVAASKANVIINFASSDHFPGNTAILRGMKKRHEKAGEVPIIIHTSGTGVLADDARGDRSSDIIYYDTNPDQIETLPDTQNHRSVDMAVVAADKAGYARTYIIVPSVVYGLATGKLADAGIMNRHSLLPPLLLKAGFDRGQGGVAGEGKNIWPGVELNETAQLFIIVLEAALAHPERPLPHGREGFFFAENGEFPMIVVCKEIAKILYDMGKAKSPEPTPFTHDEILKYFGGYTLSTNARARADRGRALGWKPVKTTADLLASLRPEAEVYVPNLEKKV